MQQANPELSLLSPELLEDNDDGLEVHPQASGVVVNDYGSVTPLHNAFSFQSPAVSLGVTPRIPLIQLPEGQEEISIPSVDHVCIIPSDGRSIF